MRCYMSQNDKLCSLSADFAGVSKLVAETKGSHPPGTQADDAFRVNVGTDVTDAFITLVTPNWRTFLKTTSDRECDVIILFTSHVCEIRLRRVCVFVCNSSIRHPQSDTLTTHWRGWVPLHCARVRDKTSKQSRPRFYKRRNFLEQQINADPGRKRREREHLKAEGWRSGGVRIIQQQLSSVSPEQESREVEKVK